MNCLEIPAISEDELEQIIQLPEVTVTVASFLMILSSVSLYTYAHSWNFQLSCAYSLVTLKILIKK